MAARSRLEDPTLASSNDYSPLKGGDNARARDIFLRVVAYVRPYALILVAALICSVAYSAGRTGFVYLTKPMIDDVLLLGGKDAVEATGIDLPFSIPGITDTAPGETGKPEAGEADATPGADATLTDAERDLLTRQSENMRHIVMLALMLILVVTSMHFLKVYLVEYTLGRVLVDLQQQVCAKLLSLPLAFHHAVRRGETLTRTLNDAGRAHRSLDIVFGDVAPALIAIAVGASVLLKISWQLTLSIALAGPLVGGVIAVFGRRIRRFAKQRQETISQVTQRLVEILSGIKVIKAFGAEPLEAAAFGKHNRRLFRTSMRVARNRVGARTLMEGINNTVGVMILWGGMVLILDGLWGLTIGDLVAFMGVMHTVYRPTKSIAKGWAQLMDTLPSAERFFELLDERPEIPDTPGAIQIDGVHKGVAYENVTFSYGREPVLRDVSLSVPAGSVVAIVGQTGAGKTTLADLLVRFYDPQQGRITIDGTDLRDIQRESLLAQIAVVTQEPFLFDGSILDNIRYGRRGATTEEVRTAARTAHVEEFVESLPDGYHTEVGELGVQLSGGQRQRVTIARAILKDPAILIFDEATSSLDSKSEKYVQDAIDSLMRDRTVFVIAHRLSTIRRADQIVVIEDGTVSRIGSHKELMAHGGLYRELVDLQNEAR